MHLHTPSCTFIHLHAPSYTFIHLHTSSNTFIHLHAPPCTSMHLHPPSYTFIYLHLPSCTSMHLHTPSYTFMPLHTPSYTFIHLYLRNRKHVPCFYRVIQTRVEVWENEKCCGNTSRGRVFPQLFRVLPNFHECLYNSIETRSTCFLFLLEHTTTRKRKTTC